MMKTMKMTMTTKMMTKRKKKKKLALKELAGILHRA